MPRKGDARAPPRPRPRLCGRQGLVTIIWGSLATLAVVLFAPGRLRGARIDVRAPPRLSAAPAAAAGGRGDAASPPDAESRRAQFQRWGDAALFASDPQWPVAGDAAVTTPLLDAATPASMSPPPPLARMSPAARAEHAARVVVGVAFGMRSNVADHGARAVFLDVFLASFLRTAQTNYVYRLYFAFDHDDWKLGTDLGAAGAAYRAGLDAAIRERVVNESARRPHPPGHVVGETVDASALLISAHWVECAHSGKPSWAHSDAAVAAVREGAEYIVRVNDDTEMPAQPDWLDRWVAELRARRPIRNFGLVGPACAQGPPRILTHDFTHRTHVAIFGTYYPRSLPNWSSDDWSTLLYVQFNATTRRDDTPVVHHLTGRRYHTDEPGVRIAALRAALEAGAERIAEWAREAHGVALPYVLEQPSCC